MGIESSEGVKHEKVRWTVEGKIWRMVDLYELMFALILALATLHSKVLFCGTIDSLTVVLLHHKNIIPQTPGHLSLNCTCLTPRLYAFIVVPP